MLGPKRPWSAGQGNGLKGELVMMGQSPKLDYDRRALSADSAGPKKGGTAKQEAGEKSRFLLRILQGLTDHKSLDFFLSYPAENIPQNHRKITAEKHDKFTTKTRQEKGRKTSQIRYKNVTK